MEQTSANVIEADYLIPERGNKRQSWEKTWAMCFPPLEFLGELNKMAFFFK